MHEECEDASYGVVMQEYCFFIINDYVGQGFSSVFLSAFMTSDCSELCCCYSKDGETRNHEREDGSGTGKRRQCHFLAELDK